MSTQGGVLEARDIAMYTAFVSPVDLKSDFIKNLKAEPEFSVICMRLDSTFQKLKNLVKKRTKRTTALNSMLHSLPQLQKYSLEPLVKKDALAEEGSYSSQCLLN